MTLNLSIPTFRSSYIEDKVSLGLIWIPYLDKDLMINILLNMF